MKSWTPTAAQLRAVEEIDNNLQIVACAGSGKTEVISRRIAHILHTGAAEPENIVAFTFTNKAAASLMQRIIGLVDEDINLDGMQMCTIHSFCYKILTDCCPEFEGFSILDSVKNYHFVCKNREKCGLDELGLTANYHNIKLFLQCMDVLVDHYDDFSSWKPNVRCAFEKYQKLLYENKFLDFRFIIWEVVNRAKTDPNIAERLKQIRFLTVDEYQDINDLQEQLISLIAEYGANICVVGDDDQTIYGFRGSNAENMIGFSERYPDVKRIYLDMNFRCDTDVIDIANTVISKNICRLEKEMQPASNAQDGSVTVKGYDDATGQYHGIADEIIKLHNEGVAYCDMAVLVRKGKHIAELTQILREKHIVYATESSDFIFDEPYFNKLCHTLSIVDSLDKATFFEIWEHTIEERTALQAGYRYLRDVRGDLHEMIVGFAEKTGFLSEDLDDFPSRKECFDALLRIVDDFESIYRSYQLSAKIKNLISFIEKHAAEEYRYISLKTEQEIGVQIMTVHKSKGLEFDAVFLPHLEEGEFPTGKQGGKTFKSVLGDQYADEYSNDIEDERKLFYVAVSRAKHNLFMSYSLEKKGLSIFLKDLAESQCIYISRHDLEFVPSRSRSTNNYDDSNCKYSGDRCAEYAEGWEEERIARQAYYSAVRQARSMIMDYYGSGRMYSEMAGYARADDNTILREAHRLGMI